jgi:hypothetical protein
MKCAITWRYSRVLLHHAIQNILSQICAANTVCRDYDIAINRLKLNSKAVGNVSLLMTFKCTKCSGIMLSCEEIKTTIIIGNKWQGQVKPGMGGVRTVYPSVCLVQRTARHSFLRRIDDSRYYSQFSTWYFCLFLCRRTLEKTFQRIVNDNT